MQGGGGGGGTAYLVIRVNADLDEIQNFFMGKSRLGCSSFLVLAQSWRPSEATASDRLTGHPGHLKGRLVTRARSSEQQGLSWSPAH